MLVWCTNIHVFIEARSAVPEMILVLFVFPSFLLLIEGAGLTGLLDFQSGVYLNRVPRFLHTFLKKIDMSGVYKNWSLINPESLDETFCVCKISLPIILIEFYFFSPAIFCLDGLIKAVR